ncbi:MAG: ABC transporter ATP-binding protein, partial [Candidatus Margulisiibacteriota bacterium]
KVTIILTTHYMEEAEFLCDRIGIIDHGKIATLDTLANLKATHGGKSLEDIFLEYTGKEIRNTEVREKVW